jgi:hypothetical protein
MFPAVPTPPGATRRAIELKLKPGWRFEAARGRFVEGSGRTFAPPKLPRGARIVYKAAGLARADPATLSGPERELLRYLQVIVPVKRGAALDEAAVRSWPCAEEVSAPPEISLP